MAEFTGGWQSESRVTLSSFDQECSNQFWMTNAVIILTQIDSKWSLNVCLMLICLLYLIKKELVKSLLCIIQSTAGSAVIFDA